ncbi:hypothetical protein FB451DRAFT_692699 [Mycena latifolia]|nr:hypothetical protein FB451DRAFT_692699 [Mycena latifolia]
MPADRTTGFATLVTDIVRFVDSDVGVRGPNAAPAFAIPQLPGVALATLYREATILGELPGVTLGRQIYRHCLQISLFRVGGRAGCSAAQMALITDLLSAENVVFALLRSAERTHNSSNPHPLHPATQATQVQHFWAVLALAFRLHPDGARAAERWIAGWVYPIVELTAQKLGPPKPTPRLPRRSRRTGYPEENLYLLAGVCSALAS